MQIKCWLSITWHTFTSQTTACYAVRLLGYLYHLFAIIFGTSDVDYVQHWRIITAVLWKFSVCEASDFKVVCAVCKIELTSYSIFYAKKLSRLWQNSKMVKTGTTQIKMTGCRNRSYEIYRALLKAKRRISARQQLIQRAASCQLGCSEISSGTSDWY